MNSLIQGIADRQSQLAAVMKSDGFKVPAFARNYAVVTKRGMVGYNDSESAAIDVDERRMAARFIVSTLRPDRDGDIVIPNACVPTIENYRRNPVVFFGHQQVPFPIGSSTSPDGEFTFAPEEEQIASWVFFHGKTPESNTVFHLVATKQLNCASLGFNPLEAERLSNRHKEGYYEADPLARTGKRPLSNIPGWLFRLIDVIEWSIVGIPANSEAIAVGLSKGIINGDRLSPLMRKSLQPYAMPRSGAVRSGYNRGGIVLELRPKEPLLQLRKTAQTRLQFLQPVGTVEKEVVVVDKQWEEMPPQTTVARTTIETDADEALGPEDDGMETVLKHFTDQTKSIVKAMEQRRKESLRRAKQPINVTVNVPPQPVPQVTVNVPPHDAPSFKPEIKINVPRQPAPIVNVPAAKVEVKVDVPKQDPPQIKVDVTPEIKIELPKPRLTEKVALRDKDGNITRVVEQEIM